MDGNPWTLAKVLLPRLPSIFYILLANRLGYSPASALQTARTELVVSIIRSLLSTPRPLSALQAFGMRDPGVRGDMWVVTARCEAPGAEVRDLVMRAARDLGGHEEVLLPDIVDVEGEWTGYRAGSTGQKDMMPMLSSEEERYRALLAECTSPTVVLYSHGGAHFMMDPVSSCAHLLTAAVDVIDELILSRSVIDNSRLNWPVEPGAVSFPFATACPLKTHFHALSSTLSRHTSTSSLHHPGPSTPRSIPLTSSSPVTVQAVNSVSPSPRSSSTSVAKISSPSLSTTTLLYRSLSPPPSPPIPLGSTSPGHRPASPSTQNTTTSTLPLPQVCSPAPSPSTTSGPPPLRAPRSSALPRNSPILSFRPSPRPQNYSRITLLSGSAAAQKGSPTKTS